MSKTALIIAGTGVQDHEFIYPYYRLKEAGYEVFVALKDGVATTGFLGSKIPCDIGCTILSYQEIACMFPVNLVVIPGGAKCMEYLRQEHLVLDFIAKFNETGKPIASICHGAQMLISAKIVKGRNVSGYYSIKDDIENAGATYIDAPYVRDGNLITCPHYKYLGEWMKAVLESVNANTVDQPTA